MVYPKIFKKAISIQPDYLSALNNLAVAQASDKNYKDAMAGLSKIISLNSEYGAAYANRGYVKELQGDLQGACADWKIADKLGVKEAKNYILECK